MRSQAGGKNQLGDRARHVANRQAQPELENRRHRKHVAESNTEKINEFD